MKTLLTTAAALTLLATSTMVMASETNMPTYQVTYKNNVDIIVQQTNHALQHLNYQRTLDINNQTKNNIEYIGARLNQQINVIAKQSNSEMLTVNSAK